MNALAQSLVPMVHRAFCLPVARSYEDAPLLAGALDALDGFLAAPVPSRYLRATRALAELTRLRRRGPQIEQLARRSLDTELARLDAISPTSEEEQVGPSSTTGGIQGQALGEVLRGLPADPRAARRIAALVALLEAHRELAQRVRAPEQHRARIALPQEHTRRVGDRRAAPVLHKRRA